MGVIYLSILNPSPLSARIHTNVWPPCDPCQNPTMHERRGNSAGTEIGSKTERKKKRRVTVFNNLPIAFAAESKGKPSAKSNTAALKLWAYDKRRIQPDNFSQKVTLFFVWQDRLGRHPKKTWEREKRERNPWFTERAKWGFCCSEGKERGLPPVPLLFLGGNKEIWKITRNIAFYPPREQGEGFILSARSAFQLYSLFREKRRYTFAEVREFPNFL